MDIDFYFDRAEAEIVADISDLEVPTEILLDQDGWSMLCAVRGRCMAAVSGDRWSELCRIRSRLAEG
jgi:hypothetical protein